MKRLRKELILETLFFALCVFFMSVFYNNNLLLVFLLLTLYLIGNHFWHSKHDKIFFIIGFILGPLAEIVATYFGVWKYSNPTFFNIPIWLPFAWGLASLMITRIAETFVKIERK